MSMRTPEEEAELQGLMEAQRRADTARVRRKQRHYSARDRDQRAEGPPQKPPPRSYPVKGAEFEADVGQWERDREPHAPPSRVDLARWAGTAHALAERLGGLLETLDHAAESGDADRWDVLRLPAIEELQAALAALAPGWRGALEQAFARAALARHDSREREARQRADRQPVHGWVTPAREPWTGETILRGLRQWSAVNATEAPRHVPRPEILRPDIQAAADDASTPDAPGGGEPLADLPAGLTPEIIDALLPLTKHANDIGGPGITPREAVRLAELGARDPEAFRGELRRRTERRKRRKKRAKPAK